MAHRNIQFGSIVHHHDVPEPGGKPSGPHFAVVISPDEEIKAGGDLRVAVITRSFDRPLRDGWFEMVYTPGNPHPVTGLSAMCVAKATWIARLPQGEVDFRGKHVQPKTARAIDEWYKSQLERARQHAAKKKDAAKNEPKTGE